MKLVGLLRECAGLPLRSQALEGIGPNLVSPPRSEVISTLSEGTKEIIFDADEETIQCRALSSSRIPP